MKNILFVSVLNVCAIVIVLFLYDTFVVQPQFEAVVSAQSRVTVGISDIINDDASEGEFNDSILIPIQAEADVPSLEPDYVLPEDDLIPWEDLTPEEQQEIEEKMAPIE